MDDLVDGLAKSLIDRAINRVIHGFEFPITEEAGIGTVASIQLQEYAALNKIDSPVGIVIKANTNQHPRTAIGLLSTVVRALVNSGLVDQDRIRQFHFDRMASNEETIECYIISLDD